MGGSKGVSDNSGIVVYVSCNPQSGIDFNIGQTVVTCQAVDGSGNRAECSFDVNVKGKWLCNVSYLVCFKSSRCLSISNGLNLAIHVSKIRFCSLIFVRLQIMRSRS